MCNKITCPFPKLNGAIAAILELTSDLIHTLKDVIPDPCGIKVEACW